VSHYPRKKVTLVQSSNRLLSDKFPLKLSKKLQKDLESKGVRVVLGQRVEKEVLSAGKGNVVLMDGSTIAGESSCLLFLVFPTRIAN
jgi:NADH dehydrogenase FAD-containing subunit